MRRFWAAHALLPGGAARDVTFDVDEGRFTAVTPGTAPGDATRLPGAVLPGFADAHCTPSTGRCAGGRTTGAGPSGPGASRMYAVADRLDPDSYLALARAAFAETALAGVTAVGEFHYLHHAPDGRPYADPNAMGHALAQAAADAGIRLTLLDTCYLAGGRRRPPGRGRPAAVLRRLRGRLGGTRRRAARRAGAADRRGRALRAGGAPAGAARRRRGGGGADHHASRAGGARRRRSGRCCSRPGGRPAPARAPLRAARRERGLPRGARPHPHRPARRRGPARPRDDGGARHPPHRRRRRPARGQRHHGVPVPDHRARPRRRHRARPGTARRRVARSRSAATSTPSSICSPRHAALEMHERLASGERGRFTPADLLDALTAHSAARVVRRRAAGGRGPRRPRRRPARHPADGRSRPGPGGARRERRRRRHRGGRRQRRRQRRPAPCSATSVRCCRRRSNRCGRTRERPSARLGAAARAARRTRAGPRQRRRHRDRRAHHPGSGPRHGARRRRRRRGRRDRLGRPAARAPAADRRIDVGGRAVVPGFVDSHTHLVFAGDRAAEFAARMRGERYDGGGIASTVAATRAADDDGAARAARPPGSPRCTPRAPRPSRSRAATASPSPTRSARCAWPPR